MPSSRVFSLLVGSAVLLGSTAGVFAVGSTVPTASSSPQAVSDDAGVPEPSSPDAAAETSAKASSSASKAPSSPVATSPRKKAPASGTGSASSGNSATGSSGSGSTGGGSTGSGSAGSGSSGSGSSGSGASVTGSAGAGASSASPARPIGNGRVWIGTTSGGYQLATSRTGVGLAHHAYSAFGRKVPQAEMITVKANAKWRDVANAKTGSSLHGQIAAWARTLKARGGSPMLAYSHEPETKTHAGLGTATEYIAAWHRVKAIFDSEGATNVVWAWQMTAYSFKTKSSSPQYAAKWYPGDDVIDIVAADGYNWGSCRGRTASMADFTDPVIAFAKAHGKKVVLGEFGSMAGPSRAAWLKDAHRYLIANRDMIVAAFYFNLHDAGQPCHWTLTTAAEYAALRAMATDTANFRV